MPLANLRTRLSCQAPQSSLKKVAPITILTNYCLSHRCNPLQEPLNNVFLIERRNQKWVESRLATKYKSRHNVQVVILKFHLQVNIYIFQVQLTLIQLITILLVSNL
jgi:hypothetical protein